jgi:hypothetical protein
MGKFNIYHKTFCKGALVCISSLSHTFSLSLSLLYVHDNSEFLFFMTDFVSLILSRLFFAFSIFLAKKIHNRCVLPLMGWGVKSGNKKAAGRDVLMHVEGWKNYFYVAKHNNRETFFSLSAMACAENGNQKNRTQKKINVVGRFLVVWLKKSLSNR